MAMKDVKPTRSELIEIKKKIILSEAGYNLLKMKRDGLILEFFEIMNQAKTIRQDLNKIFHTALDKIAMAKALDGKVAVKAAALSVKDVPLMEMDSRNIMGVVVPVIEAQAVHKKVYEQGYGLIGSTTRIDDAVDANERLVDQIILSAEIETTLKRLLDDIEKTKRRVNALEFKVIPELKEQEWFIMLRLEEMERENIFRLKRIKAKSED